MIGLEYFYKQLAHDSVAYLPLAVYLRTYQYFYFGRGRFVELGRPVF